MIAQSEIEIVRALLTSKPRPVGWTERRQRLDEVGSVWPIADDVRISAVDVDGVAREWSIVPAAMHRESRYIFMVAATVPARS